MFLNFKIYSSDNSSMQILLEEVNRNIIRSVKKLSINMELSKIKILEIFDSNLKIFSDKNIGHSIAVWGLYYSSKKT